MTSHLKKIFILTLGMMLAFSCQKSENHEQDSQLNPYQDHQQPGNAPSQFVPEQDSSKQEEKTEVVDVENQTQSVSIDINNMIIRFMERDFSQYEVDTMLNLNVAYKTRLTFFPALWKKLNSGSSNAEGLKSSRLKVNMVFLKDGYNQQGFNVEDVIAAHEFVAVVDKFKVIQDEILKFRNASALLSRMTIFLSLQPLEGAAQLEETALEGMIYPISVGGVQDFFLKKSKWSAKKMYDLDRARQAIKLKQNGLSLLSKYQPLNTSTVSLHQINEGVLSWVGIETVKTKKIALGSYINELMAGRKLSKKNKKQMERALCVSFYRGLKSSAEALAKNLSYQQCLKDPSEMLNYGVRWVTSGLSKMKPEPVGFPSIENFNLSQSISFSSSENVEKGKSARASAQGSASLGAQSGLSTPNFFEGVAGVNAGASANLEGRLSLGGELYSVASATKSMQSSQNLNLSKNVSLTAERLQFRIKARAKKCLVVTLNRAYLNTLAGLKSKGFYFCQKQDMIVTKVESYFLLFQNNGQGGSPLSDNLSASENPLRMLVRGTSRYASLKSVLSGPLVLRALNSSAILNQHKQLGLSDLILNQDFPGMISTD